MEHKEPTEVLYRLKRGLSGYFSYLSACEMNEAFSEYMLYEPMLRIINARGFDAKCEYRCPGSDAAGRGDKKRIDFHVEGKGLTFAIEAKWAKHYKIDLKDDCAKLELYCRNNKNARAFVLVFGRLTFLKDLELANLTRGFYFKERGTPVFALFGRTKFGCRIFEYVKGEDQAETRIFSLDDISRTKKTIIKLHLS